jgi:hypothetical protein
MSPYRRRWCWAKPCANCARADALAPASQSPAAVGVWTRNSRRKCAARAMASASRGQKQAVASARRPSEWRRSEWRRRSDRPRRRSAATISRRGRAQGRGAAALSRPKFRAAATAPSSAEPKRRDRRPATGSTAQSASTHRHWKGTPIMHLPYESHWDCGCPAPILAPMAPR